MHIISATDFPLFCSNSARKCLFLPAECSLQTSLIPISFLHVPGSERGETLVGAGHVSPREKLGPGRVLRLLVFVKIYCPLQKEASALLRAAHAKLIQLAIFFSGLHFASYCNSNFKAKQVRCLEALYFGKDVVAILPKGHGKIMIFHLLLSQCYGISS